MDHLKRTLDKICHLGWKTAPYPTRQEGMLFYGAVEMEVASDYTLCFPPALVYIEVWADKTMPQRCLVKLTAQHFKTLYNEVSYYAWSDDCEGRLLEAIQAFARINEWPPVRFQFQEED